MLDVYLMSFFKREFLVRLIFAYDLATVQGKYRSTKIHDLVNSAILNCTIYAGCNKSILIHRNEKA